MDRRIDELLDQHPHWSAHRRIVARVARLMLRQEALDKELKQKGLLVKGTGAPKDALEVDFKIENYIRRYLELLPTEQDAGGHRGPVELIFTHLKTCPHCGENLATESVFGEEMAGSAVAADAGSSEPDALQALAPGEQEDAEVVRQ